MTRGITIFFAIVLCAMPAVAREFPTEDVCVGTAIATVIEEWAPNISIINTRIICVRWCPIDRFGRPDCDVRDHREAENRRPS